MSEAAAALSRRPAAPVVSAAELGLWNEAAVVLAQAQAEAEATRQRAAELLQAEQARGFEAGLRAAATEVARQFARLSGQRAALEAQVGAALPGLLCDLLERITGEAADPQRLTRLIRHVLAQQRWDGRAVLRVAPSDQAAAAAALANDPRAGAVTVETDATLAMGACLLECAHGSIALGLAAQLRALREGLDKGWTEMRVEPGAANVPS